MSSPYEEGHAVGTRMRLQRQAGDFSYDCRHDLANAARGNSFEEFKAGLDDGLDGKAADA